MKVFVTGGTGFIGSHLVDALIRDDRYSEVRCLVRSEKKWLEGKNIIPIKGNMQNLTVLKEAVEGVDIIFHLAAITKASDMRAFEIHNVEATENLIRTALKKGVQNIVTLSSLAAAGPSFNKPVDELSPLMPVSQYGKSKKQMEEVIHSIAENQADLSVKILRPPAVYGPRDEEVFTFFKMASLGFCPVVGNADHPKIALMYVKDVVQALFNASKFTKPGVHTYFIAGPRDYSWPEIKKATERALDKKVVAVPVPSDWITRIGSVVERAASLFGVYPVFNREKAKEMTMQWTCSIEKAKKELHFAPEYSLQEGINTTINWYKKHHWL